MTPGGGSPINMTYTGVGEGQRTGAGTAHFQFDATGMSMQTAGSATPNFTTLPDGSLLSETLSSGTYYYLSDGAGNVAGLCGSACAANGSPDDSYSYDPMGNATQTGSTYNPFTFQGWMYGATSGFYYTGASGYYDPSVGLQTGCKDAAGDPPPGGPDIGEDSCGEDEAPYDDGTATACGGLGAYGNPADTTPFGSYCATARYHPHGILTIKLVVTAPPLVNGLAGTVNGLQGHLDSGFGGSCSLNTAYMLYGSPTFSLGGCTLRGEAMAMSSPSICVGIYLLATFGLLAASRGEVEGAYANQGVIIGRLCFPY